MGRPLDDAHRVLDDLVDVGELLLRLLLAGEIQEPLDDRRAALGFADHQVHVLGIGALVRHLLPQQVREGQDAGEGVVQLVRHARGQEPDRGELFPAHGLGLRPAQLLRAVFHFLLERMRPFAQLRARFAQGFGHAVERNGELAELVGAAHRYGLVEIAGGEPVRAAFEVAQRQIDQTVNEEADRQRRDHHESDGKGGDPEGAGAQFLVDRFERIVDVEHAKDGGLLGVVMTGGIVAGRFVADDFHAAEQRLAVRTLERPGALAAGKRLERQMALREVHRLPDFGRVGRKDDPALVADDPDPVDFLLVGHIVDDAVDIGGLVLQHGEAGAAGDHLRELGDVIGYRIDDLTVHEPGHHPGEQEHGHRQRNGEVEHDLELEGPRLHGCRYVPFSAGKGRNRSTAATHRRQLPRAENP